MSLPPVTLDDATPAAEDPFAALRQILGDYNIGKAESPQHVPLWIFARDAAGKVQGGLLGQTYWSWCSVNTLAVAEPYRGQGIGSRLLGRAEAIARARGCIGIHLDTVSFQAPDFYRRLGYAEFGRIADFPPGHTRIWLMKRL